MSELAGDPARQPLGPPGQGLRTVRAAAAAGSMLPTADGKLAWASVRPTRAGTARTAPARGNRQWRAGWSAAATAASVSMRSNGSPYSPIARRAKACWTVDTRSERPRPRKLTAQCSTAVTRFLKPTR